MREELYNMAAQLIRETTEKLGKKFVVANGVDSRVSDICDMVGDLMGRINAYDCFAEASANTKVLTLGVVSDDMVLKNGRTDAFFELIQHVESFSFSKEKGALAIRFNIHNIWRYL